MLVIDSRMGNYSNQISLYLSIGLTLLSPSQTVAFSNIFSVYLLLSCAWKLCHIALIDEQL